MKKNLRLIPLLTFCALVLLGYKVVHLAGGLEALTAVSPAQASEQTAAGSGEGQKAGANTTAPDQSPEHAADGTNQPPMVPPAKSMTPPVDPAEMAVLSSLSARRAELDKRAKDIDTREQLLAAAQTRIDERLAELKALEARMNARVSENDKENEARLASVVQLYESMKPKDAARIFERLDMGVLIDVAKRMSPRKLAPVMSAMDPVVAQDLTVELAVGETLIDVPEKKMKTSTGTEAAPIPAAAMAPPQAGQPG